MAEQRYADATRAGGSCPVEPGRKRPACAGGRTAVWRWARSLWCTGLCCAAACAVASVEPYRMLTEQEAGDARIVVQHLRQSPDAGSMKAAQRLRRQGERQMQRGNWPAAFRLFGKSMVRYPAPEALAGYADAEIRMLAQMHARQPRADATMRADVRHAVRFYESSLAADTVLGSLPREERSRIERNAGCLRAFIRTGDRPASCEPLQWYASGR
ncbi:hypothetical protein C8246_06640 [Paracidovorax avenae]|nr:hypothetical protein C8246_06640 [Paracidovorax avenae]AVS95581.1 hypothetical protein C8232_04330 [Paracidovorax avenae]AVT02250.1 hypothetical protein C8243_06885 [Paracidovorax avenae]AVT09159.1 hypothetical protein C8242_06315 [Paracidovorax avenae]